MPSLNFNSKQADGHDVCDAGTVRGADNMCWETSGGSCLVPKGGHRENCIIECTDSRYEIHVGYRSSDVNSRGLKSVVLPVDKDVAHALRLDPTGCLDIALNHPNGHTIENPTGYTTCMAIATDGQFLQLPATLEGGLPPIRAAEPLSNINVSSCDELEPIEQTESCLLMGQDNTCAMNDCHDVTDGIFLRIKRTKAFAQKDP